MCGALCDLRPPPPGLVFTTRHPPPPWTHPPPPHLKDWAKFSSWPLANQKICFGASKTSATLGGGGAGPINHWAARTRKRHQHNHRPQRLTESSDPTQHAKGRTGDCPGPRKGATTRRTLTQGGGRTPSTHPLTGAPFPPRQRCSSDVPVHCDRPPLGPQGALPVTEPPPPPPGPEDGRAFPTALLSLGCGRRSTGARAWGWDPPPSLRARHGVRLRPGNPASASPRAHPPPTVGPSRGAG